jgi:hypothetical protein
LQAVLCEIERERFFEKYDLFLKKWIKYGCCL